MTTANTAAVESPAGRTSLPVAAHTPGEWIAEPYPDPDETHYITVYTADKAAISDVYPCGSLNRETNARLIAAAPELYWALKQIIADLPSRRDWLSPDLERAARAAIARAEGGSL